MKFARLTLRLPHGRSEIHVGENMAHGHTLAGALRNLPSKNAFVFSDRALRGARARFVGALKKNGWRVREIPVDAGEKLKSHESAMALYDALLNNGARRDGVIFALGGGSVGDAVGFIASTYLRGLSWVGVPTTLLAQVDSSIGGKTALNHKSGKNLVGTFWQPAAVLSDVEFLKTLSQREMISGLGEALKYGLIYDRRFFEYIRKNWNSALRADARVLTRIVSESAAFKAHVVEKDEFDRKGLREALNFGHSVGHALENLTGYKKYQHGEAVLWGMRFALALSQVRKHLLAAKRHEIEAFLQEIAIPPWPSKVGVRELLKPMSQDKKVRDGRLHFVLLKDFGKVVSDSGVTERDLKAAYRLLFPKGQATR